MPSFATSMGILNMAASDLLRLSELYQETSLMHELVRFRLCPPEALRIIFDKTVKNNEMPMSGVTHWAVEDTFLEIAHRADTPPDVLGKVLNVAGSPEVRLAALKNPHVPRSEKVAYEETLCARPLAGSHYGEEFQLAAADADAPPQVLQCLADQGFRYYVAINPHAPTELLQQLTRPDIDERTRKAAQENIQKRLTAQ